jgi:dGTPase
LEVAQIGKALALKLGADPDLVEAASLAHDIGHPPFGHVGESRLKALMWSSGGFEANAQNLRVLSKIEVRSRKYDGLNLTRATLDALLKYKTSFSELNKTQPSDKAKFYYDDDKELVNWACSGILTRRSFDCEIMEWADDIAYSTHDLEDGIKAGMISRERLEDEESELRQTILVDKPGSMWQDAWDWAVKTITNAVRKTRRSEIRWKSARKETISNIISAFVRATSYDETTGYEATPRYSRSLKINENTRAQCDLLKGLVWQLIITEQHLATLARKAENIIDALFHELATWKDIQKTIQVYPSDYRELLQAAKMTGSGTEELNRITCDYISGMTDAHAIRVCSRLTQPEFESLLEFL